MLSRHLNDAKRSESLYTEIAGAITNTNSHFLKGRLFKLVEKISEVAPRLDKEPLRFEYIGLDIPCESSAWMTLEDVLGHIIRNSLDHGIEKTSERLKKQKNKAGMIFFALEEAKDRLRLIIRDDGGGLNLSKLRKIGVLKEDSDPFETAMLIFRPNLSTADKVSDISGRGVGMDAVKSEIEALGGHITLGLLENEKEGYVPIQFTLDLPADLFDSKARAS